MGDRPGRSLVDKGRYGRLSDLAGRHASEVRAGLDGTKIKANASKHKAMSYERMAKRAEELEAEVASWLDAAAAADASEDAAFGRDRSGEEMPDWVADKKRRAEKIRAAKAELEAEAKAAAEAERKARAEAEKKREAAGRKKPGRPAAPPSEDPDPKAQKNFTDPESRIMKTKDGFIQGYNAQAAVDAEAQVIVAHGLDAKLKRPASTDADGRRGRSQHGPQTQAGLGRRRLLFATPISRRWRARDRRLHRAGRAKHPTEGEGGSDRVAAMREKIKAGGHESPYRLRKQLPEPVFGQIKQARGFRQFLLRGARQGRQRVGPRLPRPQYAEARPRGGLRLSPPPAPLKRRSAAKSPELQLRAPPGLKSPSCKHKADRLPGVANIQQSSGKIHHRGKLRLLADAG